MTQRRRGWGRDQHCWILRVPAGYDLDAALATTYTLDFETALVVPATLAFHENCCEQNPGGNKFQATLLP